MKNHDQINTPASFDDELTTVVLAGSSEPERGERIPGASPDSAGFVGDYRPLEERQADPSAPQGSDRAVNAPATFTVGRSYSFSSICDSDCVWTIEIVKRTAKTVTFLQYGSKTVTRRIKTDEDRGEWIEPHGRYSMSATCWAGRDEIVPSDVAAIEGGRS